MIGVFDAHGASWQLSVDAPEDLHLALFVRDAARLTVSGAVGPLRDAPDPEPVLTAGERAAADRAWQAWWEALLGSHRATSGRWPDGLTPEEAMAWRYQPRLAACDPPDFAGLADSPALRRAATRAWREAFPNWWDGPPGSGDGPVPDGGVRGDLLAAIMDKAQGRHVQDVVRRLERDMRRTVKPFELTIDVLAVRDDTPTLVAPGYALVPIDFYTDAGRYPDWLRQAIAPLA